ncbi:hypothetical protein BH10CYA1_BH10CYA1_54280 [soil metagenome]
MALIDFVFAFVFQHLLLVAVQIVVCILTILRIIIVGLLSIPLIDVRIVGVHRYLVGTICGIIVRMACGAVASCTIRNAVPLIAAVFYFSLSCCLTTGCHPSSAGTRSSAVLERVLGYENEPAYDDACSQPIELASPRQPLDNQQEIIDAQAQRLRKVEVTTSAQIWRLLPTDENRKGFRHQRFLIRLNNGTTILVANDLTVGQMVPVNAGDIVEMKGEYIWTRRGGVLHWTHHSDDQHVGGWIRLGNQIYQ